MGIRYLPVNPLVAKRFRLTVDHGVLVLREGLPGRPAVMPNSAAARCGIKETDVILALNNTAIDDKNTIEDVLEKVSFGQKIPVKILRKGKEVELTLSVEEHLDSHKRKDE